MSKFCPKHILAILFIFVVFSVSLKPVYSGSSVPCGNGVCQQSLNETCVTCPKDCGICATSTPTATPQPTSPPTPPPTSPPTAPPTGQPTTNPTSNPTSQPTSGPTSTSESTPSSTDSSGSFDSSSSTSSSPEIIPTISLNPQGLIFTGSSSISEGVIDLVEYSIDGGNTWFNATPIDGRFDEISENFQFSLENIVKTGSVNLSVRAKSLAGVYSQGDGNSNISFTIQPPKVILDKFLQNPTKNQNPTISGVVSSSYLNISKVEVSLDQGKTWFLAKLSSGKFSFTANVLEDGNYPVQARSFDTGGNVGLSKIQTLIVDTIPPLVGGGVQSLGSQILNPDNFGVTKIVAGTQLTISLSMKGGVTDAKIVTPEKSFSFIKTPGTNIWSTKAMFEEKGEKILSVEATDGADNTTQRILHTISVEDYGKVLDSKTQKPIENAVVSIYLFEPTTKNWVLWDALAYGQNNPITTGTNGDYSFMVPPGKFYIEAKSLGLKTIQTQIFTTNQTQIVNFTIPMQSKPKIVVNLPFIGNKIITTPTIIPQTYKINTLTKSSDEIDNKERITLNGQIISLSLPDLSGKNVNLSDFVGKKVLVSFISPWTSPSVEQAPILSSISESLGNNQKLLVVSLQESTAVTETFVKRGKYKFQTLVDKDGVTAEKFNITLYPQHFFINTTGKIQEVYVGVLNQKDALEKLSNLR